LLQGPLHGMPHLLSSPISLLLLLGGGFVCALLARACSGFCFCLSPVGERVPWPLYKARMHALVRKCTYAFDGELVLFEGAPTATMLIFRFDPRFFVLGDCPLRHLMVLLRWVFAGLRSAPHDTCRLVRPPPSLFGLARVTARFALHHRRRPPTCVSAHPQRSPLGPSICFAHAPLSST